VEAQKANIDAATASVQASEAQIKQTIISAPFSGILAKQDVEVGEVAPSNVSIMTLINGDDFKVEIFASEVDAGNIKVGEKAEITLDNNAGKLILPMSSQLIRQKQCKTMFQLYKVTLNFDEKIENIKSGTDADVTIITGSKDGVIQFQKTLCMRKTAKILCIFPRPVCEKSRKFQPEFMVATTWLKSQADCRRAIKFLN